MSHSLGQGPRRPPTVGPQLRAYFQMKNHIVCSTRPDVPAPFTRRDVTREQMATQCRPAASHLPQVQRDGTISQLLLKTPPWLRTLLVVHVQMGPNVQDRDRLAFTEKKLQNTDLPFQWVDQPLHWTESLTDCLSFVPHGRGACFCPSRKEPWAP